MKFLTHEDIAAPIERVFAEVSNFEGFERAALRRGAEIVRLDELAAPAAGMKWDARFAYRNRPRRADLELVRFDQPNALGLTGTSSGVEMLLEVELVALSRNRTRLNVATLLNARSISARLLLQSLKLARNSLDGRYRKRVADYAKGIEARHAG